jgi:polyisoprenoid-binding protein YceI
MTFASSSVVPADDGTYVLLGDLTINGTTRLQQFDLEFHGLATVPMDGSTHAGFSATGALSRKDFGIDFDIPMAAGGFVIGDKVTIDLNIELSPHTT